MTEDVERAGKSLMNVEKRSETTNIFQFRMEWNGFIKEMMEKLDQ